MEVGASLSDQMQKITNIRDDMISACHILLQLLNTHDVGMEVGASLSDQMQKITNIR
jgi:hypothetical protein